jgi:hypothetical protein
VPCLPQQAVSRCGFQMVSYVESNGTTPPPTMTATIAKATKVRAKAAPAVEATVVPAEPTATEAAATEAASQAAIVPAAEAQAISRWEAIACDIAIAEEAAATKRFDYRDSWDNKQARSYVHGLRLLKGKIERARKDAKAVHLERGKAVDENAKLLEASVQGLIEPHETAIKAIEAEEEARIEAHRAVLDRIAALVEGVETAPDALARLEELRAIDTTTLEEFSEAGANRSAEALERLQTLFDTLAAQEAERLELEALRADKAAREEAERIAQIQREAVEAERLRLEGETERKRLEAEQQARQEREAAAAREAQAQAQVEAARLAQEAAERRAQEASEREQVRAKQEAEAAEQLRQAAARAEEARQQRRDAFVAALTATLTTMDPGTAAAAIANGELHPAVQVDWSML